MMNIKTQKIKRSVLKKLKLNKKGDEKATDLLEVNKNGENEESEEEEELNSDEELQLAFARKHLKPGLNVELAAPKTFVNDKEGLKRKLKDLYLDLNWIERMDVVVGTKPIEKKETEDEDEEVTDKAAKQEADLVNDDFKRESRFMQQAKEAAQLGLAKLEKLGVPTTRPEDYFAEMVKSDEHMKKVRENLLSKHAEIERREKVRKLRELKKMGKQIQQEAEKKKIDAKRSFNESVKKFKKGEKDDLMIELENDDGGKEDKKAAKKRKLDAKNGQNGTTIKKKGKKAQYKDKKYGWGGRKKRSKYNTAESHAQAFKGERKTAKGESNGAGRNKPAGKFANKNKPKKKKH